MQIHRDHGGLCKLMLTLMYTKFWGSFFEACTPFIRCGTAFLQKTAYQCSFPNQPSSVENLYEGDTEMTSFG